MHGGIRLAAVNAPAAIGGLEPGLTLAAARAVIPNVETTPNEPERDAQALQVLSDWCGGYTPWTAPEALAEPAMGAGVWLDVTGCAHLFGGEDALLDHLLGRVHRLGFAVQAALADTPGAAWGVARYGRAASPQNKAEAGWGIVAPGGHRQVLKRLPVAALRPPRAASARETFEGLDRLGLRRIGDLYDLPRGPLAARFGEALVRRLDQALGRIVEPISPREPIRAHQVRLAFPEAIGHLDDVAAGLGRLLKRLEQRLADERLGLRRAELTLYRVDGAVSRATVGASRPVRDPDHLQRLFAERLDGLDLGFGVEVMTITASVVEPLAPVQLGLDEVDGPAGDAAQRAAHLGPLIDRLATRLGRGSVIRLEARASHIPERAGAALSALDGTPRSVDAAPPLPPAATPRPTPRPRPLRLFDRPQIIDAVAEVPDGPPVLFRWRRVVHRVVHAEGPERIAPEWWRDAALPGEDRSHLTRDYYRIEDIGGRRFWLFREGLYDLPASPQAEVSGPIRAPRWFLHGVFA
jgi:protein ImuB